GPSGSTLNFELTISDGNGANSTDAMNVAVQNTQSVDAELSANTTTLHEGESSKLDASSSTGNIASYEFEQIAGTAGIINIDSSNPAKATFAAPSSVPADENATLKVTVADSFGEVDSAVIELAVRHNKQPIANAGPDRTVNEGNAVTLDGTASSDQD